MSSWFYGYGAALVVLGVLDGVWLGFIARDFYSREIGDLMVAEVRKIPAAVFYLGYPAGLVALALQPLPQTLALAATRAALFGLVAYGVYDLSNMATLRHWGVKLVLVDMAWGMLATALAGSAAWWAMK